MRSRSLLAFIGPGLLVAATGVGAGDLATAGFAASRLGVAVAWAIVVGACLKFVVNEGLARWQLATGETLLEGAITRLGPAVTIVFLLYLLPWSYFVGAALMSACGVTMHAIAPVFDDAHTAKMTFAAAHSAAGLAVAWLGGFRLFERIMAGCIAVMFVAVVVTATLTAPDLAGLARGLVVPRIPSEAGGEGLTWTIALMGGVGGTLTVLCYGYWMSAEGRTDAASLPVCRIDLAVAYAMTAVFGISMLVIADGMPLDNEGADLIAALATQIEVAAGPAGRWIFLAGAWAAVVSSLLGVWQAVPSIFADAWTTARRREPGGPRAAGGTRSAPYRLYLLALATIPIIQVTHPLREVQKYYAVVGAAFIPLLAAALLVLNGRAAWTGRFRNRPLTTAVLVLILVFFLIAGVVHVRSRWG